MDATRSLPVSMAVIAGRRRCERHRSPCCLALMRRFGPRCPQRGKRSISAHGRKRSPTSSPLTARLSSTSWSRAPASLRSQVEEALAELVAAGLVSSDNFGGLRALLVPSGERRPLAGGRRRRRTAMFGMEEAGRRALVRRPRTQQGESIALEPAAVEHLARTLLQRYGVVFWRLLEREANWLPPWRELLRVYRTLERRGEIRGGRFVAGFSGEQFALPDAIGMLREARRQQASGALISLSGADPLNLAGILTPGPKLAALTGNRLLFRDGLPIACSPAARCSFSKRSIPRASGKLARLCCGEPPRRRWLMWPEPKLRNGRNADRDLRCADGAAGRRPCRPRDLGLRAERAGAGGRRRPGGGAENRLQGGRPPCRSRARFGPRRRRKASPPRSTRIRAWSRSFSGNRGAWYDTGRAC